MNLPEGYARKLKGIVNVLSKNEIPYYIHAGFAVFLHSGGDVGDISDCDIRVYGSLEQIERLLSTHLDPTGYKLHLGQNNRSYLRGKYDNNILEVLWDNLTVDLIAEMVTENDLGRVIYPYAANWFKSSAIKINSSLGMLSVASLEVLCLYYLVLRRNASENKRDIEFARYLATRPEFSQAKFLRILKKVIPSNSYQLSLDLFKKILSQEAHDIDL